MRVTDSVNLQNFLQKEGLMHCIKYLLNIKKRLAKSYLKKIKIKEISRLKTPLSREQHPAAVAGCHAYDHLELLSLLQCHEQSVKYQGQ